MAMVQKYKYEPGWTRKDGEWFCLRKDLATGESAATEVASVVRLVRQRRTQRHDRSWLFARTSANTSPGKSQSIFSKDYYANPSAFAGAPDPPLAFQQDNESLASGDTEQAEENAADSRSASSCTGSEDGRRDDDAYSTFSDKHSTAAESEATAHVQDSGYGSGPASVQPSSVYSYATKVQDIRERQSRNRELPDSSSPMECVRKELESSLDENGEHRVEFSVYWNLTEYYRHHDAGNLHLGKIPTVTGTAENAIKTTCEDYINQTWAHDNPCDLLCLIEEGIRQPEGKASRE
jgi:hypothetical protein